MVDSKKLISLVEKYEKLIYDTADHIWAHPETGFRERKTLDTGKPEILFQPASPDSLFCF